MILVKLKQETQAYHNKMERDLNILNRDVSLREYVSLLQRFWGFYVPVEAQIDRVKEQNAHFFDLRNRKKGLEWNRHS